MTWLAGADGCKGGWVVVLRDDGGGEIRVRTVSSILDVFGLDERPAVLGIDVPIGLLDGAAPGGRGCDKAARKLLGEPRARSVFSPPARATLKASSFEEAVKLNRASSSFAIGISRQSYGILNKIRDVDDAMTPALQDRVLEVHPEMSFYELNGKLALAERKKSKIGLEQRIRLMEKAWDTELWDTVKTHSSSTTARDDIVDAMVACWTAERVVGGRGVRLPVEPERDSKGLRMEIIR